MLEYSSNIQEAFIIDQTKNYQEFFKVQNINDTLPPTLGGPLCQARILHILEELKKHRRKVKKKHRLT